MKVLPIAYTAFNDFLADKETGYVRHDGADWADIPSEMDELPEFAGRMCYQSWNRPNPETATNAGYLKNIINQGHFSVLEHASVSFYVEGVSRSLLTELERHRFLSFSVISQRYVESSEEFVIPPLVAQNADRDIEPAPWGGYWTIGDEFDKAMDDAYNHYRTLVDIFRNRMHLPKKKAMEAARSVLPNATEVKMVVTGNIRCWRDVIGKRYHEAADEEIKLFATEVLQHLRTLAPNSMQDIPEVPYG